MMWTMILLIFLTLSAGIAGWIFFLWAVKSGQYDDIEGPKYRMLDDDEEEVNKKMESDSVKRSNDQRERSD
jgi:cbb3-type cytochrome oxidase maturation protein